MRGLGDSADWQSRRLVGTVPKLEHESNQRNGTVLRRFAASSLVQIMEPSSANSGRSLDQSTPLSRVAGGLAHEIKNPLSTMAINLALLEEEFERAAQSRDADSPQLTARERRCMKRVKTLQREIRHLESIVDDFLVYSRGGEINRAPTDLLQLLRDILEFVEPEDSSQGVRHHVRLPNSLPLVMLDVKAYRQALLNLLVNARQAMPDGGEIIVQLERHGSVAELAITDTGVGIEEKDLERIFDVYWSTKKSGTGLGLATVRRVIEEHEGTIEVLSEVGRGTSFSIRVPLLVELAGGSREFGGSRTLEVDASVRAVEDEESEQ